jgi:hypothetical protein
MTRSGTATRAGFSRADLLVVTVLGLCLLGLLTPALAGGREKAERKMTENRLKAVAIALHNCNDSYRRMPPAYGKALGFKSNATLHVYLMPFLEQVELFQQYLKQEGGDKRDKAVVGVFIAPLDRTNPKPPAGIDNFAANLRVFGNDKVKYDAAVPLADTMDANARIPASIPDGTSNTIAFATKYGVCGKGGSRYAAPPKSDTAAFFGQNPAKGKAAPAGATATFQDRPSAKQCLCAPLMAQSYEAEGLLVALFDGSTRTVAPGVSPQTWNLALCPNDGMPLGADW